MSTHASTRSSQHFKFSCSLTLRNSSKFVPGLSDTIGTIHDVGIAYRTRNAESKSEVSRMKLNEWEWLVNSTNGTEKYCEQEFVHAGCQWLLTPTPFYDLWREIVVHNPMPLPVLGCVWVKSEPLQYMLLLTENLFLLYKWPLPVMFTFQNVFTVNNSFHCTKITLWDN